MEIYIWSFALEGAHGHDFSFFWFAYLGKHTLLCIFCTQLCLSLLLKVRSVATPRTFSTISSLVAIPLMCLKNAPVPWTGKDESVRAQRQHMWIFHCDVVVWLALYNVLDTYKTTTNKQETRQQGRRNNKEPVSTNLFTFIADRTTEVTAVKR